MSASVCGYPPRLSCEAMRRPGRPPLGPSSARLPRETSAGLTSSIRSVDCSFFGSKPDLPAWIDAMTTGISSVIRQVSGVSRESYADADIAAVRTMQADGRVSVASARGAKSHSESGHFSSRHTGRLTECAMSEGEAVSFVLHQLCNEYPDLNEKHRIVKVQPSVYLINNRSVEVFVEEGGVLMVRDGPMTQPLLDYVMNTGANEFFESPDSASAEPRTVPRRSPPGLVGVETMALNEHSRGMQPDQVRMSAMRYAKMAAARQEQDQENRLSNANQMQMSMPVKAQPGKEQSANPFASMPPVGIHPKQVVAYQSYAHAGHPQSLAPIPGTVMHMRRV
mmetsp:Transcript_47185/g.102713  ORF Transcript_47185/g.102713 Transcript_47185/m.102713 type:complete len:337 (-) Transcript_47185:66-1076(-)